MRLNLLSLKLASQSIHDPRVDRTKKHNLADMVAIAVYSVICGADGWEDIEFIALDRFDFLLAYHGRLDALALRTGGGTRAPTFDLA